MKRKHHLKPSITRTLHSVLAASVLAVVMDVLAEDSVLSIHSNSLPSTAMATQANSIELQIAVPGGYKTNEKSESGALDLYAAGLEDGEYHCEVFVTLEDKSQAGAIDATQLYRQSGRFIVRNTVIYPLQDVAVHRSQNGDSQTYSEISTWYEKLTASLVNFFVPSAVAANLITNPGDVYITDTTPYIYFDDTDVTGDEWRMWGRSDSFGIWDYANSKHVLRAATNPAFGIYEYSTYFNIYNHNAAVTAFHLDQNSGMDVFRADSNGDIELANGSLFIDKSANYLGVGTVIPNEDIHVVSSSPALLLDGTIGDDITIQNVNGELNINRTNGSYNGTVFNIENDLNSGNYPGVGIWSADAKAPLHVASHDNKSASLLVENTVAPTVAGDVTLFKLRNTGSKTVRFSIDAGSGSAVWTFDNEPTYNTGAGTNSGRFRISKVGTGVMEFSVDGYGNGRFYGASYAVNHVNTSSREAKTDFLSLNEQDVLDRLMQLPLSQWRYKQEDKENRHIGPVAEDFQRTFDLGDGKHISTVDSDGIALAAIKALKSEKDVEIAALKVERDLKLETLRAEKDAEIAALHARVKALEALLVGQRKISAR